MIEFYKQSLNLKPLVDKDLLGEFYISSHCSWAYYLLPEQTIFPFHMLKSDSSWQYCDGNPLRLIVIDQSFKVKEYSIGKEVTKAQKFVHVVPANHWFAAVSINDHCGFSLVTHCITPPYKETDEICGYYENISTLIPQHKEIAKKFSAYSGVNDKYVFNSQTGYR